MNTETAASAVTTEHYGSPGAAIRTARTRAGMSVEELASRTRLARPTLDAMESDAFDQLLEPVYVRGYYRKVARILEIPEQPLIDAYEALYTPPPKIPPTRLRLASGGDLGSSPRLSARFAVIAPVIAVVLISVIWVVRQSAVTPVPAPSVSMIQPNGAGLGLSDTLPPMTPPQTPAATAEGAVSAAAVAPAELAAAAGEEAAVSAAMPADPVTVAGVAPETASTPATSTAAAGPVGSQLLLEFTAISWARVEDASGKALASGVISAGERLALDGKPPYSVFLGNAPGVTVHFGGQLVDIKPYTKGNSTARFSVPTSGG